MVSAARRAQVEWHVSHYFNTPLVVRDDALAMKLGEEVAADAQSPRAGARLPRRKYSLPKVRGILSHFEERAQRATRNASL